MNCVVVSSIDGWHEGEIVSGNALEVARSKGVTLLLVEPELLRRSAFAGWSKRSYGVGWVYSNQQSSRGCPLMLHASPQFTLINWAACIVRDPELGPPGGSLRLAMDTAQQGAQATGILPETSPVRIAEVLEGVASVVVQGKARASIPADMFLAVQLYGMLSGARVRWFAMSQSQ